jgi:hypothetical protein
LLTTLFLFGIFCSFCGLGSRNPKANLILIGAASVIFIP